MSLPQSVVEAMATHEHRVRHYLWHGVRNSWLQMTDDQKESIRGISAQWEPPRPGLDESRRPHRDNNSGEDFLYMHRQMIAAVDQLLQRAGDPSYPKVIGWSALPKPGDGEFPVPPLPGVEEQKSDDYFLNVLKPWEEQYKSETYLREVTLGQLGSDLEFTIHNDMHVRWAAVSPLGNRPRTPLTQDVAPQWDDPRYDFLLDTYSSHVNPVFWKLHGWVDDRITDWARVHEVGNIQWTGKWEGPMGHNHHGHRLMAISPEAEESSNDVSSLDQMMTVLEGVPDFDGFFEPSSAFR